MNLNDWAAINGPVLTRREYRQQSVTVDSAVRKGLLTAVLPGVYVVAGGAQDRELRMAAVMVWRPDAVLCTAAAARLTFWPELLVSTIDVASRARCRGTGFRFHRRVVPVELITERHGLRITAPALTALDMIPQFGGDVIDRALRSRQVTLDQLWSALAATNHRRGNTDRRRLLLDSRDEPWSAAERLAHQVLRADGLRGWRTNYRVECKGQRYYIDIAFVRHRLAVEIDGRLHETDPNIFINDRFRQNALVDQGWTVLRFTYGMLLDEPEYVLRMIRRALGRAPID